MLAVVVLNIVLNLTLIPILGIQGAALATFLSYLLCYCIRIADTRRYVPFGFSALRTIANTVLILIMCIPVIFSFWNCLIWELAFTVTVIIINYKPLLCTAMKLLKREA